MKKIALYLVLITILLGGCTTQDKQAINDRQLKEQALIETGAIAKAKEKFGIKEFPDHPGKVEVIIHGGGPPPGIKVPGEFETKVEKDDENSYIVTFTETWNAKDFHYAGQNGPILSHYFKYKVLSTAVEYMGNGGDFPPQSVK